MALLPLGQADGGVVDPALDDADGRATEEGAGGVSAGEALVSLHHLAKHRATCRAIADGDIGAMVGHNVCVAWTPNRRSSIACWRSWRGPMRRPSSGLLPTR